MNDYEEDMAALREVVLDVDECVYWEVDIEYAQGDMV